MGDLRRSDDFGDYADPVPQLLLIGKTSSYDPAEWPDYGSEFGIGHDHIGSLVRLACDAALHHGDPDSSAVWAPMHAWRALGQLRAEAAVEPLLKLLTTLEDEAADQELPIVFGLIGPAAIPHIARFLSDRAQPAFAVATAISGLTEIVARFPEVRCGCIAILARTLQPHADADPSINGFAVLALIDLRAVEAIEVIRDAFRRNAVDISIAGDEEDVEIELGLRDRRTKPAPHYVTLPAVSLPPPGADRFQPNVHARSRSKKTGRNDPCPCGSGKKYKKCCLQ